MSDPKQPNPAPQSGAPNAKPQSRRFRWSRVVLVLSLALNLAVIGMIVGAMMGNGRSAPPRALSSRDVGYAPFISALDRGERRALARELRRAAPSRKDARSARRDGVELILDALRADPYDPAGLETALSLHREDLSNRQQVGQDVLVERLHKMSPSERQSYADRLDQILTRPERPDHHRDGPRREGLRNSN
ncbi:MAG: putative membrane protein [Halocynthiibacter sp.]|jgi:uncharacterized membrane protein